MRDTLQSLQSARRPVAAGAPSQRATSDHQRPVVPVYGPHCARALAVVAVLVGVAAGGPVRAAIYTVGDSGDEDCTHHNLQGAILSAAVAGDDEVRLARNLAYTNEAVHLTNWGPGNALTLRGGYDNCADTTASGRTTIDGTGSPVVEVDTTGANTSNVTLRNLLLAGSSARGLLVEGNSTVMLMDTAVIGNAGGGIQLTTGATLTLDADSTVEGNTTGGNGGGIRCTDGHLIVAGVVGFADAPNVAGINGGGIFAGAGCDLELLDGALVQSNQALSGGGIAAGGGATVSAQGGSLGILVARNAAIEDGGGVHATDSGTTVSLTNVGVAENAATRGGGLAAAFGAVVTMDQHAPGCVDVDACSRLTDNTLDGEGGGAGAAAYAEGGHVDVWETLVDGNRTLDLGPLEGSVFEIIGSAGRLRLEGVAMRLNVAAYLVSVGGTASAEVAFVTASRNGRVPPLFAVPARPLEVLGGSTATLYSSIFWPNGSFLVDGTSAISEADCLIVSSTDGLPGDATLISQQDPRFRDALAGDLRPGAFSPAIDFCDDALYQPGHHDRDGESRGYDDPNNPNGAPGLPGGLFDLGADEVRDILFADGFESGTTNAWSATVP